MIRILKIFWRYYQNILKNKQRRKSWKINLIQGIQIGNKIIRVKDETVETMHLMRVNNHIEGGRIKFLSPHIDLMQYTDAIIFPFSDFILVEGGAIWYKSSFPQFTKVLPGDKDLIDYTDSTLYIRKPDKVVEINNGFSFCGVHSNIWAHFLIQYLPKVTYALYLIEKIHSEITIIIPKYYDPQIKEIITSYFKGLPLVNILELDDKEAIKCKKLYYIENTSTLSDHSKYISPSDIIIPHFVLSFLKEKFLDNQLAFPAIDQKKGQPIRRLFIKRNGIRNILNIDVIENYFLEKGFELVSPQEYSIEEKRKLFQEASVIVGPISSGFTNIIFCKPGTKVMVFSNFQRSYDLYISTVAQYFEIDLLALTGNDIEPYNIHSSYSIPLEKIISSYKKFAEENAE